MDVLVTILRKTIASSSSTIITFTIINIVQFDKCKYFLVGHGWIFLFLLIDH